MSTVTHDTPAPVLTSLSSVARALVADDRGLLAIDESIPTCNRRFATLGIAQDEPTRRAWRGLILTTLGLRESINGVILCDETIRQRTPEGVTFLRVLADAGMIAGIKVDRGAHPMAGHPAEMVTEGLDGLRGRLVDYVAMGARFAKWRAVFTIGAPTPSRACLEANAHALARYAALCQECGLVPVVEPEVLMDGDHPMARCAQVTDEVLHAVFAQLHTQGVDLEAMLLKPNMVLAGSSCPTQPTADEVAAATLDCLERSVPPAVAGIAFLSGGQSGDLASTRLALMNVPARAPLPWPLAFSYGRAIQQPALSVWGGAHARARRAQRALLQRAEDNRDARQGRPPAPEQLASEERASA